MRGRERERGEEGRKRGWWYEGKGNGIEERERFAIVNQAFFVFGKKKQREEVWGLIVCVCVFSMRVLGFWQIRRVYVTRWFS